MHSKCKCGGTIEGVDAVVKHPATPAYPYETYETVRLTPGKATFRCNRCGKFFLQGLRQKKEKEKEETTSSRTTRFIVVTGEGELHIRDTDYGMKIHVEGMQRFGPEYPINYLSQLARLLNSGG